MIPFPSNDHDKPSVLGIAVQASSAAQPNAIVDPDYLLVFTLQHRDDNRPPCPALATAHRQQSNASSHISSARSARPLSQFARNIDCRSARCKTYKARPITSMQSSRNSCSRRCFVDRYCCSVLHRPHLCARFCCFVFRCNASYAISASSNLLLL